MTAEPRPQVADLIVPDGSTEAETLAKHRAEPFVRHGSLTNAVSALTVKFEGKSASAFDMAAVLTDMAAKVEAGSLEPITNTLLSQGVMLDVTATDLMRRAWENAGQYPEAFHRYMTLALKAQTQSRASLEALARIHQPREQIVRHVHVYEGGQAVVAEQLHMHGPGVQNGERADQSHAAGTRDPGERAALPCPDPLRNGVPISSGAGKAEMQDARRDKPRRPARQRSRAQARSTDG